MPNIKKYELKKNPTSFEREIITCSRDSSNFIRRFYQEDIGIYESFFILLLDQSNATIGYAKISQGGVAGTVVDAAIVAKYAIDSLSRGVVLAHNHPSGNLTPSVQDREITAKIKAGLELFDIRVLDHVILTEENYLSFADEGLL